MSDILDQYENGFLEGKVLADLNTFFKIPSAQKQFTE